MSARETKMGESKALKIEKTEKQITRRDRAYEKQLPINHIPRNPTDDLTLQQR